MMPMLVTASSSLQPHKKLRVAQLTPHETHPARQCIATERLTRGITNEAIQAIRPTLFIHKVETLSIVAARAAHRIAVEKIGAHRASI